LVWLVDWFVVYHLFRTLIYHGVNAVYKLPPYHPATTGFDATTTLSDIDAANLQRWGFNVVRLGVLWPGLEPGARGVYDTNYLDKIETIVTNLGKHGIQVILDMHQDLWHRKFCGEGVPDYVFSLCKATEPANTKPFPQPAVSGSYPVDEEGNPTLEACLSEMFATYYLSAEVGAGFQCLYDNVDGLWDAFAGFWQTVARRFAGVETVLGYELLNEPWAGDVYQSPRNLLPQLVERQYLQPLYEHAHSAIRAVDNETIVFFEGLTIDYWTSGFSSGPGGAAFNDRQALAYHIYCPAQNTSSVVRQMACDAVDDLFLAQRRNDAARLGVGLVMTEFGAAEAVAADLAQLARTTAVADRFQQSWMYWQFKYFQDITTCTPQGESLYNADGSICAEKLDVLSRTYPQAVAGQLENFEYDVHSRVFRMHYRLLSPEIFAAAEGTGVGLQTEIYVNRELAYPHGLKVSVSITSSGGTAVGAVGEMVEVSCPSSSLSSSANKVLIVQVQDAPDSDLLVKVEIVPCNAINMHSCSCKWLST
jgi:endoglycosylceramidase